jgi:hypothetical protein
MELPPNAEDLVELPSNTYNIGFDEEQLEIVNNFTLHARRLSIEEISFFDPTTACRFLYFALKNDRLIMPTVEVFTPIVSVTSEMDGKDIAYGFFLNHLSEKLAGDTPEESFVVNFYSFKDGQRDQKLQSIVSADLQFAIGVEPPALMG